MIRFSDWQSRLAAFLATNARQPFAYGSWDCCLAVCDAILTMTGTDIAEDFRGRYSTRVGALDAIRETAGRGTILAVAEYAAEKYAMSELAVNQAKRGDMVTVRRGKSVESLGLVAFNGKEIIVAGKAELLTIPVEHAHRAWSV